MCWQETLCEILEESIDRQDDIFVWDREWNPDKINAYQASCIGLIQKPNHDLKLLSRMLRCFCDAESGGMQNLLRWACELFCDNPFDDGEIVSEVIKAAPEMLKRSPECFGGYMMSPMVTAKSIKIPIVADVFKSLPKENKQIIIDYWVYKTEKNQGTQEEHKYTACFADWLDVSGLDGGNSKYFMNYFRH